MSSLLHVRPPFASPVALADIRPRAPVHDTSKTPAPLQRGAAPLLVHPMRELVPAAPDMFVTPSWLAACSTFERRAACDPATSRHRRQAPARAHARIIFRAGHAAADIPVPVTAA